MAGKKVLLVDFDSQGNMSSGTGVSKDKPTVYELISGQISASECIKNSCVDGLDIISASIDLSGAAIELVEQENREFFLKNALNPLRSVYDYIFIDCPPSLGVLTLNALVAVEEVIIPLQPHFLALHGLSKLLETIELVSKRLNSKLRVSGVVLCLYDGRTTLANDVKNDVKSFFGQHEGRPAAWRDVLVFDTNIRRNIRLAEAPSYGQSIFDYDAKSNGAEDYRSLASEVLQMTKVDTVESK